MHSHFAVRVTDSSVNVHLLETDLSEANVEPIGNRLDELAKQVGECTLRLDFGRVKYLTSAVLGKLISLHTQVKRTGGHFQVVNVGPDVYDMFKVTRLNTFIDVQSVEGAQPRLVV
jgi:anti-sigma B factor antagonist